MTETADIPRDAERGITISRVFDAPRELVFKAWTKLARFAQWFGGCDYTVGNRQDGRPARRQPGRDILVAGSAGLIDTLRQHNLIDEYQLMVFPIVVGKGKRLFRDGSATTTLKLVGTKTFSTGVVVPSYQPAGQEGGKD